MKFIDGWFLCENFTISWIDKIDFKSEINNVPTTVNRVRLSKFRKVEFHKIQNSFENIYIWYWYQTLLSIETQILIFYKLLPM